MMDKFRGVFFINEIVVFLSGNVFYYYVDMEEECFCVIVEIIDNFFLIIVDGLVWGKELYEIFCGICYGNKGDGNGYLVSDDNSNVVYFV